MLWGRMLHRRLEGRLKLFNSYCLPSVVGQSCQDFKWLIYFDALAPSNFIEKMRGSRSALGEHRNPGAERMVCAGSGIALEG